MRDLRAGIVRLLTGLCVCVGASAAIPDMPALKARVSTVLADNRLVGAAWVLVDGDLTYIDAAGTRDVRTEASLVPSDRMQVGSVAKTVLATGILRLVSEKRLSLETPVEICCRRSPSTTPSPSGCACAIFSMGLRASPIRASGRFSVSARVPMSR